MRRNLMIAFCICIGVAAVMNFVPALIGICIIMLAFCSALYSYSRIGTGALLAATAGLTTYLVSGSMFWAAVCLASCVMGYLTAYAAVKEYPLANLLMLSGLGALLTIMSIIFLNNCITGTDTITDFFSSYFEGIKSIYINFFDYALREGILPKMPPNLTPEKFQADILLLIDHLHQLMRIYLPAILSVLCGMFAYASFGVFRYSLAKKHIVLNLPTYRDLRMDRSSSWIMLLALIAPSISGNELIMYTFENLSVIISLLFVACGISLALFMIYRNVKQGYVRVIIYIAGSIAFVLLGEISGTIAITAAIIDTVMNFRRA